MTIWTPTETVAPLDSVAALHTFLNTFARDNPLFLRRDRPACRAFRTATQNIANNTETAVSFADADIVDNDNMHDPSTDATRPKMNINTPGTYLFVTNIAFTANGTGGRYIALRANGVFSFDHTVKQGPIKPTGGRTKLCVATIMHMSVGEYFEVLAWQNSGGSLTIEPDGLACNSFAAVWLHG